MKELDTDSPDIPVGTSSITPSNIIGRCRRLPRNVVAISVVSLLNDASSEIIYPLLPRFLAITLGASPRAIGIIEGGAESVSSLLKLFAGYLSDRLGKRKALVVFGYAVANFARPFIGFASSWPQVLGIRLIDRFGKGVRGAPRDAMIADSAAVEERGLAFGFHRAMDHVGAVIGPLLGLGILSLVAINPNSPTHADFTKIFLIASIPAVAAVAVAAFVIREAKPVAAIGADRVEPPRFSLRGFDSNFKVLLVLVSLFTLSNSSDVFLLLRARDAGVSLSTTMLLWAALHVSKVLSSLVGGDLSDRLGRKRLIASGWLLYALVYFGFAFARTPAHIWGLFLIYGIYFGLAEGAEKALVADLVPAEKRGTAFGLYNLAFSITVFPASVLMGAIWDWRGATTAFILSAAIGAAAALMLLFFVRVPRRVEA